MLGSDEFLELPDHRRIELLGLRVDRDHTGCITDAQYFLACELPMDISGKRREIFDAVDMALAIEDSLIKVRDAPTKGNVEVEQFGEFLCGLTCIGVSPSAERNEDLVVLAKWHIAMHHRTDADGSETSDLYAILLFDILAQRGIAVLQAFPDSLDAIGPKSVDELVLPRVAALCDRLVFLVNQHSLDTCGSEFDTENGTTGFYDSLSIHLLSLLMSYPAMFREEHCRNTTV